MLAHTDHLSRVVVVVVIAYFHLLPSARPLSHNTQGKLRTVATGKRACARTLTRERARAVSICVHASVRACVRACEWR